MLQMEKFIQQIKLSYFKVCLFNYLATLFPRYTEEMNAIINAWNIVLMNYLGVILVYRRNNGKLRVINNLRLISGS